MNIHKQNGSTLIVVLIVVLALTIIGTLAIRQSLVSLGIATNGQAQQLLMQNSDAATFNVEDGNNLIRSLARDGMFGAIKGTMNKGKELVFCFKGSRGQFFNLSQASIIYDQDGSINNSSIGPNGYCQSGGTSNFFTSNRRIVLTQVSIRYVDAVTEPFENSVRGTDEEMAKIEKTERVIVHTISLMPTLSKASTNEIDQCLSHHLSQDRNNGVTNCLTALSVPFTAHITEYTLGQVFL
ncbi:pilus assembly protein PilX [Acinetobacter sp. ANC 4558]|uniref:pilus assembly PilX family protein n=1 Tax=Acinetobacter sp. ANC 4558 TaxID=1977876 RepID=UPI000A32B599|nr:pilus assembly PilX N-terminal domain-containing protein [Acinetobacter sp. ANC 4558]OTG88076.1 pilus assembly protein PilX [Acinetobacter sp. ANC 4558]